MNALLEAVRGLDPKTLSYEALGDFCRAIDPASLDWAAHLPEPAPPGTYSRNILTLDPIEVALLRWPPGVESAVHYHRGFYGYVLVLAGQGADVVYRHHGEHLDEHRLALIGPGGLLHEPDGTIHKIVNASATEELVSLHLYFPPLETLDGMVIYDPSRGRLGELGPEAETASWAEDVSRFRRVEEDAFTARTWAEAHGKSHRVVVVKPKPSPEAIRAMTGAYYDEQAAVYDFFDFRHPTRKAYTRRVNALVAEAIRERPAVRSLLGVACGTGRRVSDIIGQAGRPLDVTGVDMSPGMVAVARERGLEMVEADWLGADLGERRFDAAIFLYSFGHVCSRADRLEALRKLRRHLVPGGLLCIDLFNRDDRHEWGPAAMELYREQRLDAAGFEPGDVFYRKADGEATAFLHYFREDEVRALWTEAGFRVDRIRYVGYTHASGELVDNPRDGFFFVEATAV
jgi:SAM-dependent methyltransferase